MIYESKGRMIVTCGCECGKSIAIEPIDDGEVVIYTGVHLFPALQDNGWYKFIEKVKLIYKILRFGEHRFHELILSKKEFDELKQVIDKVKK